MWHGPFVPDAINFTIKYMYMMEGGWSVLGPDAKPLVSGRGIYV